MCSRRSESSSSSSSSTSTPDAAAMTNLMIGTDDSFSSPLELAANNDVHGFKRSIERDPTAIDKIGLWYGRKKHSKQMVLEQRTPLMVAATYGSLDVLRLIVSVSAADVNRSCGPDNTTALHCAASGGSVNAPEAVNILLMAGADTNAVDANGLRACDVIVVSPKLADGKLVLENLLGLPAAAQGYNGDHADLHVSTITTVSNSPPLSPGEDGSPSSAFASPPMNDKVQELPQLAVQEKKEYPVDSSFPDIKNSIYATDEFRMFSFKVRPCSRAYSHDWTECPFVHPGENARRRDPRKFHYSCVPCPDFRKGACRRGDLCEYAHGVFECWLHPAQYRTRLCKDGTSCNRRVCFFAHTTEELRPLFVSTGSAVPSPRSTATAMDMALSMLPCSPSSVSMMSPSPFTPPLSPSANGMPPSSMAWPQPNAPALNITGGSLHSSRLRSSLNARDIPADEFSMLQDMETQQLLGEMPCLSSNPGQLGSLASSCNGRSKTLTPSNLDDLFRAEIASSPRYNADQGAVFSPTRNSAVFNQFQQQQQSLLSPINTGVFSPRSVDSHQLPNSHSSFLQASLGISTSSGRMSPRSVEPLSPMGSRLSALAQREQQQQQQLRSMSSRELGSSVSAIVGSPVNSSLSKWGSPSGKVDWAFGGEEPSRLRRSNSFELTNNGEEPDLSWVQSLVKDPSPEIKDKTSSGTGKSNSQAEDDTVIGAWLEQMHIDPHLAAK